MTFTDTTQRTKSLADEARDLSYSLQELQLHLAEVSKAGDDPQVLAQKFSELDIKIEQHQLRFQQMVDDVKKIVYDPELRDLNLTLVNNIKKLLKDDLSLIMLHTLKDEDPHVRYHSARALEGTTDPECERALYAMVLTDPNIEVLSAAILSFKGTSDKQCLKLVCEVGLTHRWEGVRSNAVEVLRKTEDASTLKWLREVGLKRPIEDVRRASILCLEGTTDVDCIKALEKVATEDSDYRTRKLAEEILKY